MEINTSFLFLSIPLRSFLRISGEAIGLSARVLWWCALNLVDIYQMLSVVLYSSCTTL